MRFPLGILSQYIGRKNATLVEMAGVAVVMLFGYFVVESFNDLIAMGVMLVFAKEPNDVDKHVNFRDHIACLFEKDGWGFSIIYAITFGGFIGLATFLPSYYYDQFGVTKVQAGQLTMLAAFTGAALRIFGGWISDHWGGINTLTTVLVIIAVSLVLCAFSGGVIGGHHPAADGVFCRPGCGQRRTVSVGTTALATDHGGGGLDDW